MFFNWRQCVTERVVIVLSCLLLPACSGFMTNEYAAELASPLDSNAAGTGLVILSAGSLESCHPLLKAHTEVVIYPSDGSFFRKSVAALEVDSTYLDSEFESHHGHLYILKLPACKYYLAPRLGIVFLRGSPFSTPRADFEVYANETTYLGEFYMDNECLQFAKLLLRDQEARDLTMLRSRNPAFRTIRITKRLLVFVGCDRFTIVCFR